MRVLADIAIFPLSLTYGWLFGLLAFIPVILIEGYLLKRMHWGDFRSSLTDAALANIVSTLAGVVFLTGFSIFGFTCGRIPAGDGEHFLTHCDWQVSPAIAIVVMYLLSVLIEGFVLRWRKNVPQLWRITALVNLGSYIVLLPFLIGMVTMGAP